MISFEVRSKLVEGHSTRLNGVDLVSCRCYPLIVGKVDAAIAMTEVGHPIDHVLQVDSVGAGECNRRRVRHVGSCRRGVGE